MATARVCPILVNAAYIVLAEILYLIGVVAFEHALSI